jgi:photosystem II stability/assembly factor-like uncharacterized protein
MNAQHAARVGTAILGLGIFAAATAEQNPLIRSFEQYAELRQRTEFSLPWISLGPVTNSARVGAVQGVSSRPGTYYAAVGSGSLWKTVNGGLTWTSIFENQTSLGIGDFALAPSDPNVIWVGGGVDLKKPRNFTMPGTGVFRSRDGGATWTNTGLPDSHHIGKIAVHPTNPDFVFAAVLGHFWTPNTNRGLYRTIDGGERWERVLFVDEKTGANDVVIAPSDPRVVYASTWEDYPDIFGPGSGVYKSTDGGATWARLRNGLPDGPRTGRIGLAVSWTNPDKAYALIDNLNKDKNMATELYRTTDGGATWTRTHKDDLKLSGGIGWYFGDCYVNPKDDEEVFALGVRVAHSRDGGRSFAFVGGDVYHVFPSPADPLHLDHCGMWIDPADPNRLALGNDGGFYTSLDQGATWLHHNNIPAGEFYDVAVDDQIPYNVFAGAQDDATIFGPGREWLPKYPDGWKYVWIDAWSGGDGCVTIPDPEDPNQVYFSSQQGGIRRKDLKADRSVNIMPRLPKGTAGKLEYNFIAPYILSPHNPRTLYHAGNFVFKSMNRGDSWALISPDFVDPAGAIAESKMKPGLLYVGTNKGRVWVTDDDGASWTERSAGLPNRYIRSICPSRLAPDRVYLTVSGLDSDDFAPYVFVSEDRGATWKSIHAGLPDQVAYTIQEDPINENILYLGMSRGVYLSTDRGQAWSHFGTDFPAAAVSDLVVQEREMDLVASTYGRGIYKVNLRPVQEAFKAGTPAGPRLFEIPPARLPWINDTHRDPRLSTVEKVPITFYLAAPGNITLLVSNAEGKVFYTLDLAGRKGFNQVRWDLITEKADSLEPYFTQFNTFMRPGNYIVKIQGAGAELQGTLTVVTRSAPER